MTLNDLEIGEAAEVVSVEGNVSIARRLLEMGLTRGTLLRYIRQTPLGDPIEIAVRGYHLTLRRAEAAKVRVARP